MFGLTTSLCPWGELVGGSLRDEPLDGLRAEVLEDSLLAFLPGCVQDAGGVLSAGAILHDTAGDAEGSFDRFYGFAERYLVRGSRKPGAPAAALFAQIGRASCRERV